MINRNIALSSLVVALASAGFLFSSAPTKAAVIICTEDATAGCTGTILTSAPALTVGSDGESAFDPFGAGFDTSDGIELNSNWAATDNNGWTQLSDTFTWVLPANLTGIGCGVENNTTCEPIGQWFFTAGSGWNPGTPLRQFILDANGNVSDVILLDNHGGPNGNAAEITFFSDPHNLPIPEPASIAVFGAGLVGAVAMRRRLKKSV
jgi:hypothetical protein